ncbi:MAG: acyl-CoA carboxylase subunit beta [Planctomycetota bacterium]|nr:acyl-CoA carboxylase subunit beta [Planctomycetota bacterium]
MAESRRTSTRQILPPAEPPVSPDAGGWKDLLGAIRSDEWVVRQGGGPDAIERQHKKGRLTARERIVKLCDPETGFFELGLFAAWKMYEEWGGAPSAGVITGIARVGGRLCMVIANDATVKAGAFFPLTAKKVLRAQRIAMDNRLPLIYLVDSAGVFLPLQDEVFPDEDDFGRIFRHNARLSAMGVPQLAAILGPCVAGGAYLPVMCDKIVMTEGGGLYIAGPSLVKAAIGQDLSSEELGGAKLHAALSGTIDFREADDEAAIKRIRALAEHWPPAPAPAFRREGARPTAEASSELVRRMPLTAQTEYDVRAILECIVDGASFDEYKAEYGRTLVCGAARIDGWSVGIVASQKRHVREPGRAFELGGVIYPESADKAARFVMDCNQNRVPLVFFQDVNGFMVGRQAEIDGIIRSGAKLVNAVANSVVPKFTVILGGSYGAGNYALCGKAYDPRLILAWPTCRYAVMGGEQAARTLLDLKVSQLRKQGQSLSQPQLDELFKEIVASYGEQTDPRYAAARLWIDGIIDPAQTRACLAMGLEMAAQNPHVEEFKTGVLQV